MKFYMTIILCMVLLALPALADDFQYYLPPYSYHQFDNGFQLILVENHTNPLVATIVVTRTGLRNENSDNNGVSHMLEHLTFNGTAKRTQKELYDELDYYGIYLNAQTSEDYTTYMALNHRDQAEHALDIMSDMLFHSTFPQEKFEKEKGIVAEEIRKDSENPDFQKEQELNRAFYQDTPYSMPVIGTVESIQQMTRKQVVDYYETYYSPNNMIALVVGDFNREDMLIRFEDYFGKAERKNIPQNTITVNRSFPFFFNQENEKDQTLTVKVPAPTFYSQSFIPFQFYYKFTFDETYSDFIENLKAADQLGITKVEPSYEYHPEFGILTIKITYSRDAVPEAVQNAVVRQFEKSQRNTISSDVIRTIKRSTAISEILQTDKILYYGFLKAQELTVGGLDAFEKMIPAIMEASKEKINRFIRSYPQSWAKPEQLFAMGNWPLKIDVAPYEKKAISAQKEGSRIYRHTFDNGMETILLQNQDNTVLAMHFLFKNRSAWEPDSLGGIADFLHHALFKSSRNYSKENLQRELKNIGAEIKAYDWDFIPYDDYYNVPEFSYIRILTLDQFFERTASIVSDNILFPNLSESFDEVRQRMQMLVKRNSESASHLSRIHFLKMLFGKDHPLSQSVSGTDSSINSIDLPALQAFHQKYFTSNNTILTIVSSLDSATVFSTIGQYFQEMPVADTIPDIPEIPLTGSSAADSIQAGSQQSYIYMGYNFDAPPEDEIPLKVMNDMLSGRIAFSLREQKGWAYRLGSTLDSWKNRYYFYAMIGTGRETTFPAINGLREEIDKFRLATLDTSHLEKTKNSMLGSLARRRASRETQAFTLGINSFYGYPDDYFFSIYDDIKSVSLEKISDLKSSYLTTEPMKLFYTIPSGNGDHETGMPMKH